MSNINTKIDSVAEELTNLKKWIKDIVMNNATPLEERWLVFKQAVKKVYTTTAMIFM